MKKINILLITILMVSSLQAEDKKLFEELQKIKEFTIKAEIEKQQKLKDINNNNKDKTQREIDNYINKKNISKIKQSYYSSSLNIKIEEVKKRLKIYKSYLKKSTNYEVHIYDFDYLKINNTTTVLVDKQILESSIAKLINKSKNISFYKESILKLDMVKDSKDINDIKTVLNSTFLNTNSITNSNHYNNIKTTTQNNMIKIVKGMNLRNEIIVNDITKNFIVLSLAK